MVCMIPDVFHRRTSLLSTDRVDGAIAGPCCGTTKVWPAKPTLLHSRHSRRIPRVLRILCRLPLATTPTALHHQRLHDARCIEPTPSAASLLQHPGAASIHLLDLHREKDGTGRGPLLARPSMTFGHPARNMYRYGSLVATMPTAHWLEYGLADVRPRRWEELNSRPWDLGATRMVSGFGIYGLGPRSATA